MTQNIALTSGYTNMDDLIATMPRVIANHYAYSRARIANEAATVSADYLNREIVKQDEVITFENISPFGVIKPITEIQATAKEIKNLYKKPAVARKLA